MPLKYFEGDREETYTPPLRSEESHPPHSYRDPYANFFNGSPCSHQIELKEVGGGVWPDNKVDPKLARAAVNGKQALIQAGGVVYRVEFEKIDPNKVELVCNQGGCALIPRDGNSKNDLTIDPNNPSIVYQNGIAHLIPGPPMPAPKYNDPLLDNSHRIAVPLVGGNISVDPRINKEIARAAYDQDNAVVVLDGKAYIAPMSQINPDAVELVANDDGCALIPDNNNPYDDIYFDPNDPFTYYQNGVVHHMNPSKPASYQDMRVGSASPETEHSPSLLEQSLDSEISILPKPQKIMIDADQLPDVPDLMSFEKAHALGLLFEEKAADPSLVVSPPQTMPEETKLPTPIIVP